MAADITLRDDAIELESHTVTIAHDAPHPTSSALNFQNATGFWHLSGPRTYEPGNSFAIFWNDNSDWHGPMLAVQTNGYVGVGTGAPESQLHVHGGEVRSTGKLAGYSFADRTTPAQRWVWYAHGGVARLWAGHAAKDRLTVSPAGDVGATSVSCERVTATTIVATDLSCGTIASTHVSCDSADVATVTSTEIESAVLTIRSQEHLPPQPAQAAGKLPARRALAHGDGDSLRINPHHDFKGGVSIRGHVVVAGDLHLASGFKLLLDPAPPPLEGARPPNDGDPVPTPFGRRAVRPPAPVDLVALVMSLQKTVSELQSRIDKLESAAPA